MTRSFASTPTVPLVQEGPVRWRIDRHGTMRVPGIVFASKTLLPDVPSDRSLTQVVNVAALPGIVEASYAMPDIHWGTGSRSAARIPRGLGGRGVWRLRDEELNEILVGGSRYAVEYGFGVERDLERCEDGGAVGGADPAHVSRRATQRGFGQVGSLGSGNHFLEVQVVVDVHGISQHPCERRGSRCSSRDRWGRRRTSSPASPEAARSTPRVTERGGP